jgi:ATP-binding cassette subfamily B protein
LYSGRSSISGLPCHRNPHHPHKPRLILLDEATSAVDAVTERRLQTALDRLLIGRTSFIVAHRLSTIRKADVVLVMEQGRIVERGDHASLLNRDGPYRRLYREFAATPVQDN